MFNEDVVSPGVFSDLAKTFWAVLDDIELCLLKETGHEADQGRHPASIHEACDNDTNAPGPDAELV